MCLNALHIQTLAEHLPNVAPLGEGAGALVLERATTAQARGATPQAWLRAIACAQPSAPRAWADTRADAVPLEQHAGGLGNRAPGQSSLQP